MGGSERKTNKFRDDFRQHHDTTTLAPVNATEQMDDHHVIPDQIYYHISALCISVNTSVTDLPSFLNLPSFAQHVTDVPH